MAEGFELVRTIREHLRRSAAHLNDGNFTAALADVDAALALDAHSLPAQAMRDRIEKAAIRQTPASEIRLFAPATGQPKPGPFVPQGVNAASWRGFEERIQERRFRALVQTINTSIVAGDAVAAQVALDEARELRPLAPELVELTARVAAVHAAPQVLEKRSASRVWARALGAVALLLIGVSLMIGLEWMRPEVPVGPVPVTLPAAPPVPPARDLRLATLPEPEPVATTTPAASEPSAAVAEDVTLSAQGTSGSEPPPARPVAFITADPAPVDPEPRSAPEPTPDRPRVADLATVLPAGEIPDDFVVSPLRSATATAADLSRSPLPPVRMPVATASNPVERTPTPTTPPNAAAVVPAPGVLAAGDQRRVEEVLRRYARAYGDLNASAAREVWPSVDEKALARAFQGLASQDVSFNGCDIEIRGAVANASCHGQASYVGKVGRREPRTEARLWRFELRREGEAWKIENAEARRESTSPAYRDQ